MSRILEEHLINSLRGGNAFVPLKDALNEINPEIRNKLVNNATHSIWEELEHMRLTQEDIVNYMLDTKWVSPDWPSGYWPKSNDDYSDTEWKKTYNGFFSDLQKAIGIVENRDIDLLTIIPHTKEHTYLREILLIIEHNAYHIGKILDLRKSFGDWKIN